MHNTRCAGSILNGCYQRCQMLVITEPTLGSISVWCVMWLWSESRADILRAGTHKHTAKACTHTHRTGTHTWQAHTHTGHTHTHTGQAHTHVLEECGGPHVGIFTLALMFAPTFLLCLVQWCSHVEDVVFQQGGNLGIQPIMISWLAVCWVITEDEQKPAALTPHKHGP